MLDWATNIINSSGYLGIAFAMFFENIFPPIPSELIMIFAGASAESGGLNIVLVVIAGAIGSTVGLLPWYYAGKWYGQERLKQFADDYGRFLTFSGSDVEKADRWFDRHGRTTVLIGRFLPGIRTFVAIPAAIMKMNFWTFLIFAFLGSLVWDGGFALIGYYLGENSEAWKQYIDIGTYITIGIIVVWYIYRVLTFKKKG